MLLAGGSLAVFGMRHLDYAPRESIDYVIVGIVAVGAGLAFASALLAGRRPLAAGLCASLAVLPIGGVLVGVYRFAFAGWSGVAIEEPLEPMEIVGLGIWYGPSFGIVVLSTAAWLFLTAGPWVLAAIVDFRRWARGRHSDGVAAHGDEEPVAGEEAAALVATAKSRRPKGEVSPP